MTNSARKWGIPVAVLGVTYAFIGILFALPAAHAQMWRLAAWAVSAVFYGGHICYERFRRGSSHPRAAWHVALAAGLGAFGLAVGANIHAYHIGSPVHHRLLLMLSLALWPLITAVPAFCIALVASWVLTRVVRRRMENRAGRPIALLFIGLFILLGAPAVALLCVFPLDGPGTRNYRRLVTRNAMYHAQLAQACDSLWRQNAQSSHQEVRISASNPGTPLIIQQLAPNADIAIGADVKLENDTNLLSYVVIRVGSGRGGYSIVWAPEREGNDRSKWTLSANQESLSAVLFATNGVNGLTPQHPGSDSTEHN